MIKNMDCVEGMKGLPDNSVQLTVTSPPYDKLRKYNGFSYDIDAVIEQLYRITKDGGVIAWVCCDMTINGSESLTSFKTAIKFVEAGFRLYQTLIWKKPSPQSPTQDRYYKTFEYMFIFSKGKPSVLNLIKDHKNKTVGSVHKKETRQNRECRKIKDEDRVTGEFSRRFDVWEISRGMNKTKHPAVFPIQLAKDHIMSWSNENDLVLDPFSGSGTTACACKILNRNFIGFEVSEDYYKESVERLENESD